MGPRLRRGLHRTHHQRPPTWSPPSSTRSSVPASTNRPPRRHHPPRPAPSRRDHSPDPPSDRRQRQQTPDISPTRPGRRAAAALTHPARHKSPPPGSGGGLVDSSRRGRGPPVLTPGVVPGLRRTGPRCLPTARSSGAACACGGGLAIAVRGLDLHGDLDAASDVQQDVAEDGLSVERRGVGGAEGAGRWAMRGDRHTYRPAQVGQASAGLEPAPGRMTFAEWRRTATPSRFSLSVLICTRLNSCTAAGSSAHPLFLGSASSRTGSLPEPGIAPPLRSELGLVRY